ncbi:MAG: hypothetical protein U0804_12595 [Gemmataceae bacterium]
MSKLFVMFDLETGRFIGSSLKGQFLGGLAEVHLGLGQVTVLDGEGRDLLAAHAPAAPGMSPAPSAVVQGTAACFGVGSDPAPEPGAADESIDAWDFHRWSR